MITARDIAWAAGVFEGEGCIYGYVPKGRKRYLMQISVRMTDEDVLRRMMDVFGIGSLCGPMLQLQPGRKPYWSWTVWSNQAASALMTILPFLGNRRKQKAIECLRAWRKTPNRSEAALMKNPQFNLEHHRKAHKEVCHF